VISFLLAVMQVWSLAAMPPHRRVDEEAGERKKWDKG
jgi:hypothetical protein